ncbi:unnamed protein product [Chrysodeixis includens]|uniref:Major facilitator superfamily (MFS) profile domain-containing protein n=1 Tax=Chrysodeixis includens TaxID=689277 RepID=A0A9P0BUG3_CHRIL|nr:unnamed protein product [Chrysodeixis includens]
MNGIVVQILTAFLLAVPTLMVGIGNTWPSYTLKTLESEDSPLGHQITKNDGNLIASIAMLGALSVILFVGYILDKIGRKKTEILSGLGFALGWSIITVGKSVTQILIGRFVQGIGAGLHFASSVVYIGEMSQPSIRGPLISINSFAYNIGSLVSYTEGWFCSYEVINYLNLTVAVTFVLLVLFIKETPVYLLSKGKDKEALSSLKFYRGTSTVTQEILDELQSIRNQLNSENAIDTPEIQELSEKEKLNKENEIEQENTTKPIGAWEALRTSKPSRRALAILIMQVEFSICMGMLAVQAFAGQFFSQAAPSLSPDLCSVILAIVMALSCGMSVLITNLIPRRVLMISTCILTAACMTCAATMLRWAWAPEWGIPLSMLFFCMFYHLGCVNLPYVQINECILPQINSFATSMVMSSMMLGNFVLLYLFKPAVDLLGLDGVFGLFALVGYISAIASALVMRETRNVPFEVVQSSLERSWIYKGHKY